jgi:hypothetical protein
MGNITETEKQFLNELVKDCITYSNRIRNTRIHRDQISNHKKQTENIEAILEDSLKQFFIEKNKKNGDERKI